MSQESEGNAVVGEEARSSQLAKLGIRTTQDFANVMSSLMADVLSGSVSAGRANAACNAGRQMLRAVELQLKYGTQNDATTNERTLRISTLAEGK